MRIPWHGAALLGLGYLLACSAKAPEPPRKKPDAAVEPAKPAAGPWLAIDRVGANDVEPRRMERIELGEDTVEVAGRSWNFDLSDDTAVFYRRPGTSSWTFAGAGPVAPGGFFQVGAIRFPAVGDFEILAGLVPASAPLSGSGIPAARLASQARALSRPLLVRVATPPRSLEEKGNDPNEETEADGNGEDKDDEDEDVLAVESVNRRHLDSRQPTLVPPSGDVLIKASSAPPDANVYLGISSSSDRVYLYGQAQKSANGKFLLSDAVFEIPEDPRNVHLNLIAVVSPRTLPPGLFDLASLRSSAEISRSKAVVVDETRETANHERVPYIAITRIGSHVLSKPQAPGASLTVENGDSIEVSQYERVPEGANLWILTRPLEGSLWLAQGPLMLRGLPSVKETEGAPPAVWVWPGTRLERDKPAESGLQSEKPEAFEIRAVVSPRHLPAAWIDPHAWTGGTLSEAVVVSAKPRDPVSLSPIAIKRIGHTDVDPEEEAVIGASEPIAIDAGQKLPAPYRVYLAWHRKEDPSWALVEAMPQEQSWVVPAVSFTSPSATAITSYELMAVVIRGEMPEEQIGYRDLTRSLVARSDIIHVRYEPESSSGIIARLRRSWGTPEEPSGETEPGGTSMWTPPLWIFLVFLVVPLALLVILALLEWRRGFVEPLARKAAGRIDRTTQAMAEQLNGRPPVQPVLFLLGLVLAVSMLYVIFHFYFPLYGKAVAIVTSLPRGESDGLAAWLIFLTALAGILLELTTDPEYGVARNRVWLGVVLSLCLGFILLGLMIFQALFYYTFLNRIATGMIPLLGGIAFFLIAFVEAMGFFFISRLILPQLGPITRWVKRSVLVLLSLFFHTVAGFLDEISRGKPKKEGLQ